MEFSATARNILHSLLKNMHGGGQFTRGHKMEIYLLPLGSHHPSSGLQSPQGPALAPGNLLEMQVLGPQRRPAASENLGWGLEICVFISPVDDSNGC